jgi:two-component system, LytTR family, response regulator
LKKILIVDDESLARQRIRRMLEELKFPCEIQDAENGLAALDTIARFEPDIVFLDVQMPGLDGFGVLRQIEQRNFSVIFQTAYDEYAIKAFDENACDYLLKPFMIERFEKALAKASVATEAQRIQKLEGLEKSVRRDQGWLDKVTARQGGKLRLIPLKDVICFISRDHYTCVYAGASEQIIEHSLAWLEERLDPAIFARTHRSSIVALAHIRSIGDTADSMIELSEGLSAPLSRTNRPRLLAIIDGIVQRKLT